MANAKKKAPAKKAVHRTNAKATAAPVVAGEKQWTLDEIVVELGEAPDAERKVLVEAIGADTRLKLGTRYVTGDILASVPNFVGTALAQWRGLSGDQRGSDHFVGFSEDVLAVLVAEAIALRELQRRFLAASPPGAGRKRDRFRITKSDAVGVRDRVLAALRARVPASSSTTTIKELRAAVIDGVGTAETGEPLAAGLEKLAALVRTARTKLGADWADRADTVGIDDALPARLEAKAAAVRSSEATAQTGRQGQAVDQRTLDLQDGVVCSLVATVYRAFADANGDDPTIVVPPLGRLRSLVGRAPSDGADPAPASGSTASAPTAQTNGGAS